MKVSSMLVISVTIKLHDRATCQDIFKQFIVKNLLKVHARRHPQKRLYVKNENNPHSFGGDKNNDFQKFLKLSQENIYKLRTGRGKFQEYDDLKKILESK